MLETIFYLLCWHAVADYALQDICMIERKKPSHYTSRDYGPWWWTMTAHCLINALGVAIITNIYYALAELVSHFVSDTLKCKGTINANTDQAIHVLTKLAIGICYSYLLG